MGRTKRETPRKLARKLKQIRDRAGLSQTEIAKKLGVKDRASISQFESGKIEPPLPVLLKYARLAGVSTDVLIDDKLKLQTPNL
jgi:transcriptional regulator with XRE-family HTH domain